MSSIPPIDQPRSRRMGLWALIVLLAFVGGATLASWALYSGLFARLVPQAAAPAPAVTDYQPPQTQGVLGGAAGNMAGGPPPIDPATLLSQEAALAGRLAALEARAAAVATDAAAAGAQAARAEALMVAFAARRAIDAGTGLGYLEEQLRTRFATAQPRAVAIVIAAAREPVTVENLRQGLDAIAPALQAGDQADWWTNARRELGALIVLRREGTPSTAPIDRLERARRLLADGQVDQARAEVARLPGAAQAGGWMTAARRYALAHQALGVIETAAILGQAQGTQPAVPVTAPATIPPANPALL
jgi:hypothetical protein